MLYNLKDIVKIIKNLLIIKITSLSILYNKLSIVLNKFYFESIITNKYIKVNSII